MGLDRGTVDQDLIGRSTGAGERLEDGHPDASPGPARVAIVERLARTVVGRRVDPTPSRLQDMDDAADHAAVVDPRLAPRVGWQMRLDSSELLVREPEKIAIHKRLPSGSRESQCLAHANRFMGPDPRRATISAWR